VLPFCSRYFQGRIQNSEWFGHYLFEYNSTGFNSMILAFAARWAAFYASKSLGEKECFLILNSDF